MPNSLRNGLSKSAMQALVINACIDRLENFRRYTDELDSKFHSDKQALINSYDLPRESLGRDEYEYQEIMEFLSDDVSQIENVFVGTFRRSTVVSLYSFLEKQMVMLCKRLKKKDNLPISLADLQKSGVEGSRIYLSKIAGLDFQSNGMNGYWVDLMKFNKVRNQIVHEEGYVKRSEAPAELTSLEVIIRDTSGLSYGWNNQITVERAFIDSTIDTIEKFLTNLYKQAL